MSMDFVVKALQVDPAIAAKHLIQLGLANGIEISTPNHALCGAPRRYVVPPDPMAGTPISWGKAPKVAVRSCVS